MTTQSLVIDRETEEHASSRGWDGAARDDCGPGRAREIPVQTGASGTDGAPVPPTQTARPASGDDGDLRLCHCGYRLRGGEPRPRSCNGRHGTKGRGAERGSL